MRAERITRISILGLTVSGNKGAESMLLAILSEMRRRFGACEFDLVTVYPEEDRRCELTRELNLVSGKPLTMLLLVLPLALLCAPFVRFSAVKKLLSMHPVLRSFLQSDIVLDSGGVAFIDGRGLPLLIYNMALCVPPALLGVPTVKLAQAMGPFNTTMNRLCAVWSLKKLSRVIARGDITASYLKELHLPNVTTCADSAFGMPVSAADRAEAKQILEESRFEGPCVGISPSMVVHQYCEKHGLDYPAIMAGFVSHIRSQGFSVLLVPHSIRPEGSGTMNNDLMVCRWILERMADTSGVSLIDADLRAPVLRAIIGSNDFYVASRFHSMVSALATRVPLLLVGWSHKYEEVMQMFQLEKWALRFDQLSEELLCQRFDSLVAHKEEVQSCFQTHMEAVLRDSRANFDEVEAVLREALPLKFPQAENDSQAAIQV